MNQRLDELKQRAIDEAKVVQENNSKIFKQIETTCNDRTKILWTSSYSIKEINNTKQADNLYLEVKRVVKMIEDCKKELAYLSHFQSK
jgi:hypothetical protein